MSILDELEDIERKLARGEDVEKVRREFWKVVGKIKRSGVSDEVVLKASELREKLFRGKIVMGYRLGAAVFTVGFLTSYVLFILFADQLLVAVLIELAVVYFAFLLGRIMGAAISGIGVDGFYKYNPLEFGVKVNYRDYLRAKQSERVVLYAFAIVWIHVVLLTQLALVYPSEAFVIPLFLLIVYLPFSYIIHLKLKTGELSRLIKELRILRWHRGRRLSYR